MFKVKIIFGSFLILAICAAHSHYEDCGTACEAKCNEPAPMFCTANCVVGCFCDEGYIRNSEGACVLREECPSEEPSNN